MPAESTNNVVPHNTDNSKFRPEETISRPALVALVKIFACSVRQSLLDDLFVPRVRRVKLAESEGWLGLARLVPEHEPIRPSLTCACSSGVFEVVQSST